MARKAGKAGWLVDIKKPLLLQGRGALAISELDY
tara:strand:- start:391 stop:492 length:102 start_codon:yes stop_codon:yes gene_type:complete